MIRVTWLVMTAAAATTMNLLNRLPTVVWYLLFTAVTIRDDPNVMSILVCGGPGRWPGRQR
jgi:hypothetical protein